MFSFLDKDSLDISSNKIRIGFNTTISDATVALGNIISQYGSNATGNYVGSAGTASGNLTITNAGVGYTVAPTISIASPGSSGSGNYEFNETITGGTSGATAKIRTSSSK